MDRGPVDPEEGELVMLEVAKRTAHSRVGQKEKVGQKLIEETLVLEGDPFQGYLGFDPHEG